LYEILHSVTTVPVGPHNPQLLEFFFGKNSALEQFVAAMANNGFKECFEEASVFVWELVDGDG